MVDERDLGSRAARRGGSSPPFPTNPSVFGPTPQAAKLHGEPAAGGHGQRRNSWQSHYCK